MLNAVIGGAYWTNFKSLNFKPEHSSEVTGSYHTKKSYYVIEQRMNFRRPVMKYKSPGEYPYPWYHTSTYLRSDGHLATELMIIIHYHIEVITNIYDYNLCC